MGAIREAYFLWNFSRRFHAKAGYVESHKKGTQTIVMASLSCFALLGFIALFPQIYAQIDLCSVTFTMVSRHLRKPANSLKVGSQFWPDNHGQYRNERLGCGLDCKRH